MYFSHKESDKTSSLNDFVQAYFKNNPEQKEVMGHDFLHAFSIFLLNLSQDLLTAYDPVTSDFNQSSTEFKNIVTALPKFLLFYAFINNSDMTSIDFDKVLNFTLQTLPSSAFLNNSIGEYNESDWRHLSSFILSDSSYYPNFKNSWPYQMFDDMDQFLTEENETT
jgi:hypothetical protein